MTEKLNTNVEQKENKYLSEPLIKLTSEDDASLGEWTVRNAVEGVQIFGGIGSGKTTGSGRFLALKYLSQGFGGLVLTVKPDEAAQWEDYCRIAGRSNDLIIIDDDRENRFNFLEYESRGGDTANIAQVLRTVIRAGEEKASGASQDPFWETALDMLIFHVIDLCKLAYGHVTVQQMYDIVQSLPKEETKSSEPDSAFQKALTTAREKVRAEIEKWEEEQPPDELWKFGEDEGYYNTALCNALPDARLLLLVDQFFTETFGKLSERTRSIIDFSFSGFLFGLLRDPVYTLFCHSSSNVTPDDCLRGKIIVLNLPVKMHHKIGRDCQILFKYIWQRAMEKRQVGYESLPVFLWADEAQNFLHEYDAEYQATARSSLIATVYLSQNLPNLYANMGGAKSEYRVKSFLGTLATKIFHANADIETNRYASELIGDTVYKEESKTHGIMGQLSTSRTMHLKIDRIVRPEDFLVLKTGGDRNERRTEAFVHFQGNVVKVKGDGSKTEREALKYGKSCIKMQFEQKYKPNLTD